MNKHATHTHLHAQTCKERDELHSRTSSLREMVRSLESELQRSSDALTAANTEASKYAECTILYHTNPNKQVCHSDICYVSSGKRK